MSRVEFLLFIILILIIIVLAVPHLDPYSNSTGATTAQANYEAARNAIDVYRARHGVWPESVNSELFEGGAMPIMPDGYHLEYNPETGELALIRFK